MKNEDRLFELYKIYIPLMYQYDSTFDKSTMPNMKEVREYALDQAEKALEYFNNKIIE